MSTNTLSLGNINKGTVESVRIKDSTGEITLIFDNGGEYTIEQQNPPSPPYVERVYLNVNDILVDFSDGSTTNAGSLSDLGVSRVADVRVDTLMDAVVVEYQDGTIEEIAPLNDITPKSVISTYYNQSDNFIYAVYSDSSVERVVDANAILKKDVSNQITDVTVDSNNDLIVTTDSGVFNLGEVGSRVVVNGADPEPAPRITDLKINDRTGLLEATFSDGRVIEVGKAQNVIIEGSEIALAEAEINAAGHLLMKVDSETQGIKTIDVGKVRPEDGKDGTIFKSVAVTSSGHVEFTSTEGTKFVAGRININPVVNAITRDKSLVLIKQNGDEIVVPDVVGIDGVDGVSVEDAYIDENGHLKFKMSNDTVADIDAGKVTLPTETGVHVNHYNEVVFTMSDGSTRNLGVLPIQQSRYINAINSVDGDIFVTFNDGNKEKIGNITSYPVEAKIDENGKLAIKLKDGKVITTDEVLKPLDGDGIENIWNEGRTIFVSHTTDNRSETLVKEFTDILPVGIEDITIDEDLLLTIKTNDGNSYTSELPKGQDAVSLTNIEVVDNNIEMRFSDDTVSSIELPNVVGDGVIYKETDENGNLVFTNIRTNDDYVLNVIKGQDGVGIESIRYNADSYNLEIQLTNGSEPILVPVPPVKDGTSVEDITYNDDTKSISIKYGDELVDIPLPVGTIQDNSVRDIKYNDTTEELEIHFEDHVPKDSIYIPIPKPKDGDKINDIVVDADGNLVITTSISEDPIIFPTIKGVTPVSIDSITSNSKNLIINLSNGERATVPLVKGVDGVSIQDITYDDSTNQLTIEKSNGLIDTFDNFKGKDGVSLDNVIYDDVEEKFIFIKSDGSANETPFKKAVDGKGITDIYIDEVSNTLNIEHDLNDTPTTIQINDIKGRDGIDGVGIENIERVSDDIVFTMTDGTTYTINDIGTSITNVVLNEDGTLTIERSNGDVYVSDRITGRDGNGRGIKDIVKNDESGGLDFIITDAAGNEEVISTGNIGMSPITSTTINEQGELIFTLVDATELNVGRVEGQNGKFVKSINVSSNNVLIQVISDGVNDDIELFENIKGEDGAYVVSFDLDEITGELSTTLSDGRVFNLGSIREHTQVSVWSPDQTYAKDKVVIKDSIIYVSKIDGNASVPPSGDWNTVMMSGTAPQAYPPYILNDSSTFNGDVHIFGSDVISRPSVASGRRHRQFILTERTTGAVVSRMEINSNSFTFEGIEDGQYRVTIRDVFENGFSTPTSDVFNLTVSRNDTQPRPMISLSDGVDMAAVPTVFSLESRIDDTLGTIVNTLVTVRTVASGTTQTFTSTGESIVLDLLPLTDYQVNAVVEYSDNYNLFTSRVSNTLEFTTSPVNDNIIKKPQIVIPGVNNEIRIDRVTIHASRLSKNDAFKDIQLPMRHITSDWEVQDALGVEIFSLSNSMAKTSIMLSGTHFVPEQSYKIRTRQHSDLYGSTEWSDWMEFTIVSDITGQVPVISTTESISSFPNNGLVKIEPFVSDEALYVEWRATDPRTDVVLFEANHYRDSKFEIKLPKFEMFRGEEVVISARVRGRWTNSEWDSLSLTFDTQDDTNLLMCYYSISGDLGLLNANTGHESFGKIDSVTQTLGVNRDTSRRSWYSRSVYHWQQSMISTLSNGDIIFIGQEIVCYNPISKEVKWTYRERDIGIQHIWSMEISENRFAYTSSKHNWMYILDINTGEVLNTFSLPGGVSLLSFDFQGNYYVRRNGADGNTIIEMKELGGTTLNSVEIQERYPNYKSSTNGHYDGISVFFDDNDIIHCVYTDAVDKDTMCITTLTEFNSETYTLNFRELSPDLSSGTHSNYLYISMVSSLKIEDDLIFITFSWDNFVGLPDAFGNKVFRYRKSTNNLSILNTNTDVGDVYQLIDKGDHYEQLLRGIDGATIAYDGNISNTLPVNIYIQTIKRKISKVDFSIIEESRSTVNPGMVINEIGGSVDVLTTFNGRGAIDIYPKRYKYRNLRMDHIRIS